MQAARDAGHDERQVQVRSQEGYDHSYYFVSRATQFVIRLCVADVRYYRYRRSLPTTLTVSLIGADSSCTQNIPVHAEFL